MFKYSVRALLEVLTLAAIVFGFPHLAQTIPAWLALVITYLVGGLGCIGLTCVLIVTLSIIMTPDEPTQKAYNLERCIGLFRLSLFAAAPILSFVIHDWIFL